MVAACRRTRRSLASLNTGTQLMVPDRVSYEGQFQQLLLDKQKGLLQVLCEPFSVEMNSTTRNNAKQRKTTCGIRERC